MVNIQVYIYTHTMYMVNILVYIYTHTIYMVNPLTTIVQKSILPLRDRNRAYMHGFQRIHSNVFLINIKF